jgi:hypothetical protein
LFIGVQQLDPIDGSIRSNVHVHFVADFYCRYLADFFVESNVCDIVFWISSVRLKREQIQLAIGVHGA